MNVSLGKNRSFWIKKAIDDIQQKESKFTSDKSQLMSAEITASTVVRKWPSFMSRVSLMLLQSEKKSYVREDSIKK